MDFDREMMIERLQAANDESHAEIERRREQRENDPAAFARAEIEHQQAEAERETAVVSHAVISHEEWAEPIRAEYVQKFGSDVVLYRTHDENEQTPAAESLRTGLRDDNPPAEDEFETAVDKFAATVERALSDDARRLAAL